MSEKTLQEQLRANADLDEMEGCTASVVAMERAAADRIDALEKVLNFIKRGIEANHIKCAPYFDFDPEATSIEFKSVLSLINEVLEPKP